eukprot:NODE_349_length_3137_cov_5.472425.p1 GENE.NODE_349_length_3137_cov_5.472425~~NODE_349_length_3137_cov_5.472425.p1  ORF type:complete len:890 (+),score=305.96 NODE_349_length_3137_cov_5.472425:172-2670(+)
MAEGLEDGNEAAGALVRSVVSVDGFFRLQLEAIYRKRDPLRLASLPALMESHKGAGAELYRKVCLRYGLDPDKLYTNPAAWEDEEDDAEKAGGKASPSLFKRITPGISDGRSSVFDKPTEAAEGAGKASESADGRGGGGLFGKAGGGAASPFSKAGDGAANPFGKAGDGAANLFGKAVDGGGDSPLGKGDGGSNWSFDGKTSKGNGPRRVPKAPDAGGSGDLFGGASGGGLFGGAADGAGAGTGGFFGTAADGGSGGAGFFGKAAEGMFGKAAEGSSGALATATTEDAGDTGSFAPIFGEASGSKQPSTFATGGKPSIFDVGTGGAAGGALGLFSGGGKDGGAAEGGGLFGSGAKGDANEEGGQPSSRASATPAAFGATFSAFGTAKGGLFSASEPEGSPIAAAGGSGSFTSPKPNSSTGLASPPAGGAGGGSAVAFGSKTNSVEPAVASSFFGSVTASIFNTSADGAEPPKPSADIFGGRSNSMLSAALQAGQASGRHGSDAEPPKPSATAPNRPIFGDRSEPAKKRRTKTIPAEALSSAAHANVLGFGAKPAMPTFGNADDAAAPAGTAAGSVFGASATKPDEVEAEAKAAPPAGGSGSAVPADTGAFAGSSSPAPAAVTGSGQVPAAGAEPEDAVVPVKVETSEDFWKVQVEAVYRRRNRHKLSEVPALMEKYKRKERVLYVQVCQHYDLDPRKLCSKPEAWGDEDKDFHGSAGVDDGGDGGSGSAPAPAPAPALAGAGSSGSIFGAASGGSILAATRRVDSAVCLAAVEAAASPPHPAMEAVFPGPASAGSSAAAPVAASSARPAGQTPAQAEAASSARAAAQPPSSA